MYDPKIGYTVDVSRQVNGQTYHVRTVVSDQMYHTPQTMTDILTRAMLSLAKVEENKIKEFPNPSFRRKDYVRKDQDVENVT